MPPRRGVRKAAGGLELREEFDPALIAALYNNFRSSLEALLELVDNAVDDRVPDRPLHVDLRLRRGTLRLVNRGGLGMGLEELADFLRWGGSRKEGKLGRYGQGGKAALGYLGRGWRVQTIRAGSDTAYVLEEADWHDRSRGLKRYRPREVRQLFPAPEGHVEITVTRLHRRLFPARIAARLAEVYRPLLLDGSVVMRVNGRPVEAAPLPALRLVELDSPVRAGGQAHRVRGWLGFLEAQPPAPDGGAPGGVRCYAYGRLIAAGEYFGHPDATQRLALARLVGEVHLDFVPLVMNKTDFDRDSEAWHAVVPVLREALAPLVEELSREKPPGERVSPRERRLAREVEAFLARLLRRLAEQERLPPTDADVPGAAQTDLLSRHLEEAPEEAASHLAAGLASGDAPAEEAGASPPGEPPGPQDEVPGASRDDASAPAGEDEGAGKGDGEQDGPGAGGPEGTGPASAARPRRRKRRALPIEIRPLDEHVRYQRVVRPAGTRSRPGGRPAEPRARPDERSRHPDEPRPHPGAPADHAGDQEEVLVVNNRFPLYRLRGGDRLYLLETAALELARADGVTSADEYVAELNRLLYEAARLLTQPRAPATLRRQLTREAGRHQAGSPGRTRTLPPA